jgi:hypothetical protein
MRHYKIIENGYLTAIGKGYDGIEITEAEYNELLELIRNRPTADAGYDYLLKEDLTWELVEVPVVEPTDEEISGDELLTMIEEVL